MNGGGQGFTTRTTEISGPDRPTQNFIWSGDYIAGPASPATTGPLAYYGYDVYLPTDGNPATNYPSGTDGAYVVVDPATAYHVKLPAYEGFVGPSDVARSKLFQSQLKTTITLTPDMSIENLSYYGLGHSNKVDGTVTTNMCRGPLSLQNRTEFKANFNLGPIGNELIAGLISAIPTSAPMMISRPRRRRYSTSTRPSTTPRFSAIRLC